ncbi:lytic transglycosylase domain-containing protein [Acidocella sp.]|uniref:lytic transglycosylase domain-containing protein n=1 Tax=Acidocella sp. TaxID=50710 RepID=UPI003D01F788
MIPYLKCMLLVAATTGLPPRVLPVIQALEGGRTGMVTPNQNGTEDLGVMQVNSLWLPALAARAGLSEGETRTRMIMQPCFNIAAAALVLKTYLAETHGALLPAIGDYHSHTPVLHDAYLAKAEHTARKLFGPEGTD